MNKNGFTLVELLAAIVILALLIIIATPKIGNVLTSGNNKLYELNLDRLKNATQGYVARKNIRLENGNQQIIYDTNLISAGDINPILDPKTKEPCEGYVIVYNDNQTYSFLPYLKCGENYSSQDYGKTDLMPPTISLVGDNVVYTDMGEAYTDLGATANDNIDGDITANIIATGSVNINVPGSYTITYNVSDSSFNNVSTTRTIIVVVPVVAYNAPVLTTGMTPIKWDGSAWVNTTHDDSEWYSYTSTDKKWANAKTADGSFWVWIPRYVYKISSGWHTNSVGTIDVQFSQGTDDTLGGTVSLVNTGSASDSNGTWTSHPAFTFGTTELTGIWIHKFEIVNTIDIQSIPSTTSRDVASINSLFTPIRNMETNSIYGWGTTGVGIDTHLIKNTEWGAAAYLSKSIYGKNTDEVWMNPHLSTTTGCAGNAAVVPDVDSCEYTYETANGQQASTTGNIYGIYDMAGGMMDQVAAYVNNENSALSSNGSDLLNADAKYKNVYPKGTTDSAANNYDLTINFKGDAVYETSSASGISGWYNDISTMPQTTQPFFARGGYYINDAGEAGVFAFDDSSGSASSVRGSRAALLVGTGL